MEVPFVVGGGDVGGVEFCRDEFLGFGRGREEGLDHELGLLEGEGGKWDVLLGEEGRGGLDVAGRVGRRGDLVSALVKFQQHLIMLG